MWDGLFKQKINWWISLGGAAYLLPAPPCGWCRLSPPPPPPSGGVVSLSILLWEGCCVPFLSLGGAVFPRLPFGWGLGRLILSFFVSLFSFLFSSCCFHVSLNVSLQLPFKSCFFLCRCVFFCFSFFLFVSLSKKREGAGRTENEKYQQQPRSGTIRAIIITF